ncbi:MAG: hypothetical protein DI539_30745 [Flavobacterium psychrophilum]|nr:MAG: hypothetical protein DI539_30745 [Flavobacterium psychrophilum]
MSKIILITGTSSGFGKLTAITLANAGYTVIASMRNTTTKNALAAEELAKKPGITVIDIDISDEVSVNAVRRTNYGKIQND